MSKILSRVEFLDYTQCVEQPAGHADARLIKLSTPFRLKLDSHDLAQREKIERMKGLLERALIGEPMYPRHRHGNVIDFRADIQAELSRED